MSLPKIQYPIFELVLPSTKGIVKFRPFTVKEEKLLLIGQESEELSDKLNALRQIVNNCVFDLPKDIGLLPAFDLEYCFLKIRAKSVGNLIDLKYKDKTDDKIYEFQVDLDELEITYSDNHTMNIELEHDLGIIMQYPTIESMKNVNPQLGNVESIMSLLKACISVIYDSDTTYDVKDYTEVELTEFVESLSSNQFEKFIHFFDTIPTLKHELHYTDSNGTEKTITLQGIDDFFP